jgi:hypothetical protein
MYLCTYGGKGQKRLPGGKNEKWDNLWDESESEWEKMG